MDKLEIAKQVWVNSTGKQYSVDRHEGKKGKCDYLMRTVPNFGNRLAFHKILSNNSNKILAYDYRRLCIL